MAYFSNGTEGMVFDEQCSRCKYGDKPCPIAWVQMEYNYEACNNTVARKILDELVHDNGICEMFKEFKEDFEIKEESPLKEEQLFMDILNDERDEKNNT